MIEATRAIEIAKAAAAKVGHVWIEPTHSEQGSDLHVSDNAEELGGNVLVIIDKQTGRVRKTRYYSQ